MTILIIGVGVVAYLAVALAVMRRLYGRWRAKYLDQQTSAFSTLEKDIDFFNQYWRGDDMLGAALTALVWPLSLPVIGCSLLLHRWMSGAPVKSQREVRAEREALQKRIGELERELGMGGWR